MESQSGSTTSTLERLIDTLAASEQRLNNAAEQIRNRGLKLVLKTYAQQRANFIRELQTLFSSSRARASEPTATGSSVYRGWVNIKAALIVRRRWRHRLVIEEVLVGEKETVEVYKRALTTELPSTTQQTVERQSQQILAVHERLAAMAAHHDGRLMVRLFNDRGEAEQAVAQLRQAGFSPAAVYSVPIENVSVYQEEANQGSGWRETVFAGTLLGFLCGAGAGLLVGLAQRFYFPEWQNIIIATPLGSLFELPLLGGLIGALFALIFSLLIGIDAKEDDDYLYGESLREGSTLVAVFTRGANWSKAERIIGLQHGFEVKPTTA